MRIAHSPCSLWTSDTGQTPAAPLRLATIITSDKTANATTAPISQTQIMTLCTVHRFRFYRQPEATAAAIAGAIDHGRDLRWRARVQPERRPPLHHLVAAAERASLLRAQRRGSQ